MAIRRVEALLLRIAGMAALSVLVAIDRPPSAAVVAGLVALGVERLYSTRQRKAADGSRRPRTSSSRRRARSP